MISHQLANSLLDRVFRNQAYSPPASVWAALAYREPSPEETVVDEVSTSGTGYGRKQWTGTAAKGRRTINSAKIQFADPLDIWSTDADPIKSIVLMDAETDGNILVSGSVLRPKKVLQYDPPVILYKGVLQVYVNTKGVLLRTNLVHSLLDLVFNGGSYTPPATVYLGLVTRALSAAVAAAFEVSGGSYARTAITFGAAVNGEILNSSPVKFPTSTAAWGSMANPICGLAVYTASSGGDWLAYMPVRPQRVPKGRTPTVETGTVRIALGAGL